MRLDKDFRFSLKRRYNFWKYSDSVGISLDETVQVEDVEAILKIFKSSEVEPSTESIPEDLRRTDSYLTHTCVQFISFRNRNAKIYTQAREQGFILEF